MSTFFGDESEKFMRLSRGNKNSKPYDHAKEDIVEGLSRTDGKSIIASSLFAVVLMSGLIHADEVKDVGMQIVEFPFELEEKVIDGLRSLSRQ